MWKYLYSWPVLLLFVFITVNSIDILKYSELDLKNACEELNSNFRGQNVSCHKIWRSTDVPTMARMMDLLTGDSIFFIETSCTGSLNFRQACSVEAAARANPLRKIIVLFAAPVTMECLVESPMAEVLSYSNVNLHRLFIADIARGSRFEDFITNDVYNKSKLPVNHLADVIRILVLGLYGGIYMDLDVVATKSFDSLWARKNWIGRDDTDHVSTAIMSVTKNGVGVEFTDHVLSYIKDSFNDINIDNPNELLNNAVTYALQKICQEQDIERMDPSKCSDFEIHPPAYFYPIKKEHRKKYFSKHYDYISYQPYTYHLWNSLTQDDVIYENSLYAHIMKTYCPKIYETVGILRS